MNEKFVKSISLIGDENFEKLRNAKILVVGIGGVGGTVLEALTRSGCQNIYAIDNDIVDVSNLNRQILFSNNDIGKEKVAAAKEHVLNINDKVNFKGYCIDALKCDEIIDTIKPDFVIDAIDDLKAKTFLICQLLDKKIMFISSLGMGNRIDSTKVTVTTLDKTHDDPLAKRLRSMIVKSGHLTKNVPVVFSCEPCKIKTKNPSSMMMVPSSAGLAIASFVIARIIEK